MKRLGPVFSALVVILACSDVPRPQALGDQTGVGPSLQLAGTSHQQQVEVLFGPRTFVRGHGKPMPETVEIAVADFEHYEPVFVLHLRSSDESGRHPVSSAVVALNGIACSDPRFLSPFLHASRFKSS